MIQGIPRHIGIVLDGNRRFSKRLMLKPWKGHEFGAEKVRKLYDWCMELGIKEVTLYCFSIENFNRPKEEFDYLMALFLKEFNDLINNKEFHKNKEICINFIGRLSMFSEEIQVAMRRLMEMTKENSKAIVNFAMAYGGRAEIIDATRKIAQQIKDNVLDVDEINEEVFRKNIYLESEPDLIIRTSGEQRTSGFLLWQGSYAECFFVKKLGPEFDKEDLINVIDEYKSRNRRLGR